MTSGNGFRTSVFPQDWGSPPGRPYSEERADSIRKRVTDHVVTQRYRRLAAANGRPESMLTAPPDKASDAAASLGQTDASAARSSTPQADR
jgi:hypothetical protein